MLADTLPGDSLVGMDYYIGTDRDTDNFLCLGRGFTYSLFEPIRPRLPSYKPRIAEGLLAGWLSAPDRKDLFGNSVREADAPECLSEADPALVVAVLRKLRMRLEAENERLPVTHLLDYLGGDPHYPGADVELYVPSELEVERERIDGPIVRLDGAHEEADHRMELRRFRAWVDPADRERHEAHLEEILRKHLRQHGIKPGQDYAIAFTHCPPRLPIREEPDGWLPVKAVVEVLGRRIGVTSMDKLAYLGPDFDRSIECAERAVADGLPFYWQLS